jgi:hypothetical protein
MNIENGHVHSTKEEAMACCGHHDEDNLVEIDPDEMTDKQRERLAADEQPVVKAHDNTSKLAIRKRKHKRYKEYKRKQKLGNIRAGNVKKRS